MYIKTVRRDCPNCGSNNFSIYAKGFDYEYHTCENEFSFVSCNVCSLVFLNPIPLPECIVNIYPPNYKPFHYNKKGPDVITAVRNVLERRKALYYRDILPDNARILDVGCGDGRYLNILRNVNPRWKLQGIDFGEIAVKRARESGLDVIMGTYETLDMGEDCYDLTILNQAIEHIVEPDAIVRKLHKELKTGGYLNIETPSLDGLDHHLFKNTFWGGYHFPRHITLFNKKTITAFLECRGFSVTSVRYLLSPASWVFSCHHAWEKKIGKGANFFSDANPFALAIGTILDILQRIIRNKTSNMQIIARKIR